MPVENFTEELYDIMKTFKEYIKLLNESRWVTHGVLKSKDILTKWLDAYDLNFTISINLSIDNLTLILKDSNFTENKLHSIIKMCEKL